MENAVESTVNPAADSTRGRRPRLVYFYARTSGPSRRVEGYLSQVLQRRQNHDTFEVVRVGALAHPELVEKFRIRTIPTILVVEANRISARLDGPRGRREIEDLLSPWLR
jgi:thioredoxin-like negative regulator of GroEL